MLAGRWTELRPALMTDSEWIYEFCCAPAMARDFRIRGATPPLPSLDSFLRTDSFFHGVLRNKETKQRLGIAQIYNVDWPNLAGYISLALAEDTHGIGWPLEGLLLILHHAFAGVGLDKVYFEMDWSATAQFGGAAEKWLTRLTPLDEPDPTGQGTAVYRLTRETWESRLSAPLWTSVERGRQWPTEFNTPVSFEGIEPRPASELAALTPPRSAREDGV